VVDAVIRNGRRKRGREKRSKGSGQLSVIADESAHMLRPLSRSAMRRCIGPRLRRWRRAASSEPKIGAPNAITLDS